MAMARQRLIRRREELGLTRAQVAEALRYDVTAYAKLERGEIMIRVGRRPGLARVLNWTPAQLAIALDGDDPEPPNGQAVPKSLTIHAALEQGASRIWAFQPFTVHALLQTSDYATAVESADAIPRTDEAIARRVDLRTSRQAVLDREPDPLHLSVILDESVLYRETGGPDVMARQLAHLVEMAERPNVDLQVLPLDAGRHSAAFGAFTIIAAEGTTDPQVVCVEDRTGIRYLEKPFEVEPHVVVFEHLREFALTPAESADLIRTIAKEKYQ